jgi:hypothetical protein
MEPKCFICKREIDWEGETAVVFNCFVFCEKCLAQLEQNGHSIIRIRPEEKVTAKVSH